MDVIVCDLLTDTKFSVFVISLRKWMTGLPCKIWCNVRCVTPIFTSHRVDSKLRASSPLPFNVYCHPHDILPFLRFPPHLFSPLSLRSWRKVYIFLDEKYEFVYTTFTTDISRWQHFTKERQRIAFDLKFCLQQSRVFICCDYLQASRQIEQRIKKNSTTSHVRNTLEKCHHFPWIVNAKSSMWTRKSNTIFSVCVCVCYCCCYLSIVC